MPPGLLRWIENVPPTVFRLLGSVFIAIGVAAYLLHAPSGEAVPIPPNAVNSMPATAPEPGSGPGGASGPLDVPTIPMPDPTLVEVGEGAASDEFWLWDDDFDLEDEEN
jgi:hypothetical protein